MSTYLVTGGAGFIGSHLCDALLRRGDAVRVLDDLSTGSRENLPAAATLIEGDIADPVPCAPRWTGVDGCFHLAAIASVERGVTDWLGTHRTNLTGTITAVRCDPPGPHRAGGVCVLGRGVWRRRHACRSARRPSGAALGLWRRQIRLRAACPRRRPRARHTHHRPALFQRVRTAAGPALALFRCHLDLLSAHHPGRRDRHLRRRHADARLRLCG